MEIFIYKFGKEIKIIVLAIFFGIRLLYSYCASKGSKSNQEPDKEKEATKPDPVSHTCAPEVHRYHSRLAAATAAFQKNARKETTDLHQQPKIRSLCHAVAQDHKLYALSRGSKLPRSAAATQKASFGHKRLFFKNALLMHAFITRKDFLDN